MITDGTLNVSVWDTIRTALTASTIYVTNSTTNATTMASVEASYNDNPSRPQIIIVPISTSEDTFKFGSSYGKRMISVTIECYYKNTLGIEQMTDQVDTLIRNAVLPNLGMDLVGVTTDYSWAGTDSLKCHLLSSTYSFDRE